MKIAIFCGVYAESNSRKAAGPAIVALNLVKSLSRYSSFKFTLHTASDYSYIYNFPDVIRTNNSHYTKEYLKQFDAIHVLSNKSSALKISDLGFQPILGTNVVFDFPSPEGLTEEQRKSNQHIIDDENNICKRKWKAVIVNHPELRPLYGKRFNIDPSKIDVFFSGVDTELFSPSSNKKESTVWVGPGKHKGEDEVKQLVSMLPNLNWKLYGLTKETQYSYNDFVKILHDTKIYLSLSHAETQGLATMEAMSSGCPVIASRFTCGVSKPLISNDSERNQLALNARRVIESQFTLKHMTKNYEDLIKKYI